MGRTLSSGPSYAMPTSLTVSSELRGEFGGEESGGDEWRRRAPRSLVKRAEGEVELVDEGAVYPLVLQTVDLRLVVEVKRLIFLIVVFNLSHFTS